MDLDEPSLLADMRSGGLEFSPEDTADFLAYETLEIMMYLVRAALAIRGIFVNNIERGVRDMLHEFAGLPDVAVFQELYELRRDWDSRSLGIEEARGLARRAVAVGHALSRILIGETHRREGRA